LLAKHFLLTTPPWEELKWACDKRLLDKAAAALDIDRPWTFHPRNREDLAGLDCSFPVIIKPAIRQAPNRLTDDKAWRVDDRDSLLARYDEARSIISPDLILIQEMIPGWGEAQFSYAALCLDGLPLASVVAKRTRQFPMDFGRFSTYVETIDEPGVVEPALRLLKAFRYTGLVEVEFKRDARDGRFKVLDVNPRVWGWHTLGERAGVDFSYLLWRMIHNEQITEARGTAGVRWMRLSSDFPIAVLEILRGRLPLRDYFRSLRNPIQSAIYAADDLIPGMLEMPLLIWLYCQSYFDKIYDSLTVL